MDSNLVIVEEHRELFDAFVAEKINAVKTEIHKELMKTKFPRLPKKKVQGAYICSEEYKNDLERKLETKSFYEKYKNNLVTEIKEWVDEFNKYFDIILYLQENHKAITEKNIDAEYNKRLFKKHIEEWNSFLEDNDIESLVKKYLLENKNSIISEVESKLVDYLTKSDSIKYYDYVDSEDIYSDYYFNRKELVLLKDSSIEEYFEKIKEDGVSVLLVIVLSEFTDDEDTCFDFDYFINEKLRNYLLDTLDDVEKFKEDINDYVCFDCEEIVEQFSFDLYDYFNDKFTIDFIYAQLSKNSNYIKQIELEKEEIEREQRLRQGIIDTVPDRIVDLYPKARQIKRHFYIHIGPTNSGKTHSAIEKLKSCTFGVYLGPLRLLAYEWYSRLKGDGYPCSLITGEEREEDENSFYTLSTVEMLNFRQEYDVAVIDEAQMLVDRNRGGSFTAAILGVCAKEVVVCAAPYAEDIIKKLVEECGDTYEVIKHERKTPLIVEQKPFVFPKEVQDGDALIVFSRRDVHAVALELKHRGIESSIIYGALPYDVRHNQADDFADGKTKVVVATDAIGMGMNLPVKRVIFLTLSKYDGFAMRDLKSEEVQQIAGRAGRYGFAEEGVVSVLGKPSQLNKLLNSQVKQISEAHVKFPEILIDIDGKLSEILKKWNEITLQEGFVKDVLMEQIEYCERIENWFTDKKKVYDFITMPFDGKLIEIEEIWLDMAKAESEGKTYNVDKTLGQVEKSSNSKNLGELENAVKICDLLYAYTDKFTFNDEDRKNIMALKVVLSDNISAILSRYALENRVCKRCGKSLPWNFRYNICEKCYHSNRYSNWYDADDDDFY